MVIKRKIILVKTLFLCSMLIIFISGCKFRETEKELRLRIGFFPNITHPQALIGRELGTFQKKLGKSVKVEYKIFRAGPAEIEAFLAGELDIGYIGPIPAINGWEKTNGQIKIIGGATQGGMMLISRRNLRIKSLNDLKGKKVAVPQFGNTQDIVLRFLLKSAGLKDVTKGGDVEVIQAESSDIKALLDNNQLDVALVPEPWATTLKKEISANVVLGSSQLRKYADIPAAVIVTTSKFLEKHPDIVEGFLAAHLEVTDFIRKNFRKSCEILNKQIYEITSKKLPEEVLNESLSNINLTVELKKDSLKKAIDTYFELGYLKRRPKVDEIVNLEILNKVQSKEVY